MGGGGVTHKDFNFYKRFFISEEKEVNLSTQTPIFERKFNEYYINTT
jgi:hypothetical protein